MNLFHILNPSVSSEDAEGLCALAMMTKAPEAGQVKTRLVPPLTASEAADLNKCFLRDTAAAISQACSHPPVRDAAKTQLRLQDRAADSAAARSIAVYTPIGAEAAYADILGPNFGLLPQRGDAFGERLYLAAEDLFKCGFESVCLIDSDSPTVPVKNFVRAMELLGQPADRIVLGPCDDGGYYLIGLKKLHRELFERIEWSTERVLEQTMERAAEIGVETKLLPIGYDVDDCAALRRLCEELFSQSRSDSIAPSTQKFLAHIVAQKKL